MAGKSIEAFREIGRRLAAVRQQCGLTQKDLAERVGKPPSYIAKLELAERRLDINDLRSLAEGMGMPSVALLERLQSDGTSLSS